MSGQGGQLPTQDLADQLTLSQPDGAGCVPYITICPPSFRLLPTSLLLNRLLRQKCNSIHFLDLNSCQMKSNSSLNCKHALALMMARTQTIKVSMYNVHSMKKVILFANSHWCVLATAYNWAQFWLMTYHACIWELPPSFSTKFSQQLAKYFNG